jgi:hypothetical protein
VDPIGHRRYDQVASAGLDTAKRDGVNPGEVEVLPRIADAAPYGGRAAGIRKRDASRQSCEDQMSEKKELSGLARQILSGSGTVNLFTQQEFDDAMTIAKAEIMTVAIETSRQAVMIERQACAEVVQALADEEDEGEVATALKNAAEAILNRIPTQRQ